jgi:hypothetical protein
MPRWGAPQVPHGPGSNWLALELGETTAKVESNRTTFPAPHCLHTIFASRLKTNCSNRAPQLLHSYSYIGIAVFLLHERLG